MVAAFTDLWDGDAENPYPIHYT